MMIYVTIFVGSIVVGMATTALLGCYTTYRDMATGHPNYLSLADHTGIFDRQELERLCGAPDAEDRYSVSPEAAARLPRQLWSRIFDSALLDFACLVIAVVIGAMAANRTPGPLWVLVLAACYQAVSLAVTWWVVWRNARWPEDNMATRQQ